MQDPNNSDVPQLIQHKACPACGHHVSVPFFDSGDLPLTTLAWPRSVEEASRLEKLPHDFVRCVDCGHVHNCRFQYEDVPYRDKPNLMFNDGVIWSKHLQHVAELILQRLPDQPTVVEIGCGKGQLLTALADCRPNGTYIGFDPNAQIEANGSITPRVELFDPTKHIRECRADLIISRHVLEHLMNPLAFLQALAFATSWEGVETRLFLEVPCIDGVLHHGRTVDFFYEHNSHFTTRSFTRMLTRCAADVELVQTSYNHEVVFGLAHFRRQEDQIRHAHAAATFQQRASQASTRLKTQIDHLAQSRQRVAIWGGTGKAAAFINQNRLDRQRFPRVIDSDPSKVGTFVPGSGQPILAPDCLLDRPTDVILIATHWRAADIVCEIHQTGIPYQQILIEHQGRFVDYFTGEHPYRGAAEDVGPSQARQRHVAIAATTHNGAGNLRFLDIPGYDHGGQSNHDRDPNQPDTTPPVTWGEMS